MISYVHCWGDQIISASEVTEGMKNLFKEDAIKKGHRIYETDTVLIINAGEHEYSFTTTEEEQK